MEIELPRWAIVLKISLKAAIKSIEKRSHIFILLIGKYVI